MDRSRSPSPTSLSQSSRLSRSQGRLLPRTPRKPTSLPIGKMPSVDEHMPKVLPSPTYKAVGVDASPSSINFPRVSDSPSECGSVTFFPTDSRTPAAVSTRREARDALAASADHRNNSNRSNAPTHALHNIRALQQPDSHAFDSRSSDHRSRSTESAPNHLHHRSASGRAVYRQQRQVGASDDSDDDDWC